MKKKTFIYLMFSLTLLTCNQNQSNNYSQIEGLTQGTTYHISYENLLKKDYKPNIDSLLKDFDMSLSEYIPNSIVSRINSNDTTVKIDEHFKAVFIKSKEIWEESDSLMDITVGPIIDALGFGPGCKTDIDSAKIKNLLKYVGFGNLKLENDRIIKSDTAVKLDVNSIAQGYSVDVVCGFFDKVGINNYMVEIGGEVRAKGINAKGQSWQVGIDKPIEGNIPGENLQTIISLKNQSVTTAGNYRSFYEVDGVKYTHIINPKTGFPAKSRMLSSTIVANDCITADGWDTPFMLMTLEESIEVLKKHPELEAMLIYNDEKGNFKTYMTEGFKKLISE